MLKRKFHFTSWLGSLFLVIVTLNLTSCALTLMEGLEVKRLKEPQKRTSNQKKDGEIKQHYAGYVIVGINGVVLASTNATTNWMTVISSTTNQLNDVTYGINGFVAVGANGTIITSTDATNWMTITSPTTNQLNDVTYGSNIYVAVGANGTIITSADATYWRMTITSPTANRLNDVTYGSNIYVAAGDNGTVITSADATSWMTITSPTANQLNDGTYDGINGFMTVGASGTVITSTDAINWGINTRPAGYRWNLNVVSSRSNGYIVFSDNSIGSTAVTRLLTSADGIGWLQDVSHTSRIVPRGFIADDDYYVCVGYEGAIIASPSGAVSDWWRIVSPVTNHLYGVASSIGFE